MYYSSNPRLRWAAAVGGNPIIPVDALFTEVNRTANGVRFRIDHPLYSTKLPVVHLYGSPADMGRAYGQVLLASCYI